MTETNFELFFAELETIIKLAMIFDCPNISEQILIILSNSLSSIEIKITPSSESKFLAILSLGYIILSQSV